MSLAPTARSYKVKFPRPSDKKEYILTSQIPQTCPEDCIPVSCTVFCNPTYHRRDVNASEDQDRNRPLVRLPIWCRNSTGGLATYVSGAPTSEWEKVDELSSNEQNVVEKEVESLSNLTVCILKENLKDCKFNIVFLFKTNENQECQMGVCLDNPLIEESLCKRMSDDGFDETVHSNRLTVPFGAVLYGSSVAALVKSSTSTAGGSIKEDNSVDEKFVSTMECYSLTFGSINVLQNLQFRPLISSASTPILSIASSEVPSQPEGSKKTSKKVRISDDSSSDKKRPGHMLIQSPPPVASPLQQEHRSDPSSHTAINCEEDDKLLFIKGLEVKRHVGGLALTWKAVDEDNIVYTVTAYHEKEVVRTIETSRAEFLFLPPDPFRKYRFEVYAKDQSSKGTEAKSGEIMMCIDLGNSVLVDITKPLRPDYAVYEGFFGGHYGQKVAVKIEQTECDRNTLNREVHNLIKTRNHRNLVLYIASGLVDTTQAFIALELCCTDTLHEIVTSGNYFLDPKTVLLHIIAGLSYIHEKDILHRDLQPTNVLLSLDGRFVKISDFGLSKKMNFKSKVVQSRTVGEAGWSAPECYKENANITKESDIFSAGLVFHFVLVPGEHPFGKNPNRWKSNICKDEPMSVSMDEPDADLAKKLVSCMLNKDPKKRRTANEVMKHPYFWDSKRKLEFLCEAPDFLEPTKIIIPDENTLIGENWASSLKNDEDDCGPLYKASKLERYNNKKVKGLLEFLDDFFRGEDGLGPFRSEDDLWYYLCCTFPNLFMKIYEAIIQHEDQDVVGFREMFEKPPASIIPLKGGSTIRLKKALGPEQCQVKLPGYLISFPKAGFDYDNQGVFEISAPSHRVLDAKELVAVSKKVACIFGNNLKKCISVQTKPMCSSEEKIPVYLTTEKRPKRCNPEISHAETGTFLTQESSFQVSDITLGNGLGFYFAISKNNAKKLRFIVEACLFANESGAFKISLVINEGGCSCPSFPGFKPLLNFNSHEALFENKFDFELSAENEEKFFQSITIEVQISEGNEFCLSATKSDPLSCEKVNGNLVWNTSMNRVNLCQRIKIKASFAGDSQEINYFPSENNQLGVGGDSSKPPLQ